MIKNLTFSLAWRNIWRHPRRTWLTVGAMVFSNTLLVFLISLQFGMYRVMYENSLRLITGHLQVQAPGYIDEPRIRLTVPAVQEMAAGIRGVLPHSQVTSRAAAFALVSSEERSYGVQVFGVEPANEARVSNLPGLVKRGRYLDVAGANEAVIGAALARNLKVTLGDELTLFGSGRDGSFAAGIATVVGIYETGAADIDRSFIQIPLRDFQDIFFMGDHGHAVVVMTPDLFDLDGARATIGEVIGSADLITHDWDALQPGLRQSVQADMASAWFMYGVLIVLVAFSVLNTQLMSVLDRTREFGIVMALGLSPLRLGGLVLLETAIMSGLGLVLGLAVGIVVVLFFGIYGITFPGLDEMAARFNLPARVYPAASFISLMWGPSVVFVACLAAAVYPAAKLLRMQPVAAMRAV